jgi:uncharacterized membrane-anchored protein
MNKTTTLVLPLLFAVLQIVSAQEPDSTKIRIAQIESSLSYQTGKITLAGIGELNVPKGYRYLNKKQGEYVLTDLYGNPSDTTILGLLVPDDRGVLGDSTWVFVIQYDAIGYVKDDDADDINYDDLLEEQKKETKEGNPQRLKEGYPSIEFIGWAAAPFYDKEKKTLHWAKELKFGDAADNTLNYNLRILGRKGMFVMNAVGGMAQLSNVKAGIEPVIGCITFKDGNKYSDYLPDVDNVAAWTIGGLVAGKILAKVGFFVLILKFWKIIAVSVVAAGAGVRKWWNGRNENRLPMPVENKTDETIPPASV